MYTLTNGNTTVQLEENLSALTYSNGETTRRAQNPFLIDWTGIPITPDNVLGKKITATPTDITIDFQDFQFPARFPGNTYCRPDKKFVPDFRFTITLSLLDDDLVIRISPVQNLGDNTLKLTIAQNLFATPASKNAQLILPVDYGTRFDFPRIDTYFRIFQPSASWSLPMHGLFTPEGGIGLWCEDPDRDYVVAFNTDLAGTASVTCRQLFDDMANEPRAMRFTLFNPGADFRDLARKCRKLRKESGRFKDFTQKIAEHPEVANLPGTVFWKHNVYFKDRPEGVEKTYSLYVARATWNENEGLPNNWTAKEVFDTAHERGFDRVTVCNTGWNRDGFDAGYPARLPVNPERGTKQDFIQAVNYAHSLSKAYTLSVHDNYIDAYQADQYHEDEVLQKTPNLPLKTSIWRGGQAHFLCSACGLKYAQRDIPQIAAITTRGCVYLDVSAATPLFCCHAPKHPLTRQQDWMTKRKIFNLAKEHYGALAVEGCGTDHYADIVDIGAYGGLHFTGFYPKTPGPQAVPVPFWQMVYHDSLFNYFGEGYSPVHGSEYRLYQALYTLLPTSFDDHAKRMSFELRDEYTQPLTDFIDLEPRTVTRTEDGSFRTAGVACSVFGNGTRVIANFNETPYDCDGRTIPPRDFVVIKAN